MFPLFIIVKQSYLEVYLMKRNKYGNRNYYDDFKLPTLFNIQQNLGNEILKKVLKQDFIPIFTKKIVNQVKNQYFIPFAILNKYNFIQLINRSELFLAIADNIVQKYCIIQGKILQAMSAFQEQTNQYVQQIKAGANSILVAVRVRPLSQKQRKISNFQTVKVLQGKFLSLMEPDTSNTVDVLRKNRSKEIQYAFDFVFDQKVPTKTIYDETVSILLDGLLEGYNASVLAYGATSCGKTYTMIGENENSPGIMAMAVLELLNRSNQAKKFKDIKLKATYIQIYNENIKDLLISEDRNLEIREDPKQGITIAGVTEVFIDNINQLKTVLKVGDRNRTKQSTGSNQVSSRSHGIFQIHIQIKEKAQSTVEETILSKLFLIDLAGSERASNTTNKGQRMVQGAKINQSLLVLGNCIQALSDASQKGQKNAFVPYRGSKLTRLLKDSLGGNCRTVMIAHIAPAANLFEETYNTLVYAHRAKNIKNNPIRNTLVVQTHLTNYVNIITNLKKQNEELKNNLRQKQINKNMNYKYSVNLPVIPNPAYNEQIANYQSIISRQFFQQDAILQKIYQLQVKIQQIAFIIYEKQLFKGEEKVIKAKTDEAAEMSKEKLKLEKKMQEKVQNRNNILKQIQRSQILGMAGQAQLKNQFKQKKVESALKLLKFKQDILKLEKKQMDNLIKKIKSSLKNRQQVIEKQKVLIKKNNIISRITYSQLDFHENNERMSVKSQRKKSQEDKLKGTKSYKKIVGENRKRIDSKTKNENNRSLSIEKKELKTMQNDKIYHDRVRQYSGRKRLDKISEDYDTKQFQIKRKNANQLSPGKQKIMKKKSLFMQNKNSQILPKSKSNKVQFDFIYMPH